MLTQKSDALNTILLSIGIVQMYNGIEIEHPVFRVLFCNLIVALISSVLNIIAFPIKKDIKYSTIVNGNNAFCLLFHCCCWLFVSLLRFAYIIHKDWLFARFPDPKTLNRLVISSVFVTYFSCCLLVLVVSMLCGWPRLKIFEMPMPQKAISVGTLLGIYILLICCSCSFYLFILRKRGRMRNNKVQNHILGIKVNDFDIEMTASPNNDVYCGVDQRQHSIFNKV
jgi:hypothetical protein